MRMSKEENTVLLKGISIKKETDSAILINYGGDDYWIPYSQVYEIHRHKEAGKSSIMMSEWIARQKDLA